MVVVEIPHRLESKANLREHHFARHKRNAFERSSVNMVLLPRLLEAGFVRVWQAQVKFVDGKPQRCGRSPNTLLLPAVRVTLSRIGPRALDGDNLQYAFKAIRDEVAWCLGLDDNHPRFTWDYSQIPAPRGVYKIRIKIEPIK